MACKKEVGTLCDSTGGGNLGILIQLIGKYDSAIDNHLLVRKTDVILVKPYHPRDIKFCIKDMVEQMQQKTMCIIASSLFFCNITDK